MREIRKIERKINQYEWILNEDIDAARNNCEYFLDDIECMEKMVDIYSKTAKKIFLLWCDTSVEVTEDYSPDNFLIALKQTINLAIVNHNLDKYSCDLTRASKIERKIKKIKQRLIQFKYF